MGSYATNKVFDAPLDKFWAMVSGFGDVDKWMAPTETCVVEGEGPGAVRTLTTADGGLFKEKLLTVDEDTHTITYTLVEGPLPVKDYEAKMQLVDKGDGKTELLWSSTWEPVGVTEAEVEEIFAGFYMVGMQGMEEMMSAS